MSRYSPGVPERVKTEKKRIRKEIRPCALSSWKVAEEMDISIHHKTHLLWKREYFSTSELMKMASMIENLDDFEVIEHQKHSDSFLNESVRTAVEAAVKSRDQAIIQLKAELEVAQLLKNNAIENMKSAQETAMMAHKKAKDELAATQSRLGSMQQKAIDLQSKNDKLSENLAAVRASNKKMQNELALAISRGF
ncbi:hypothetical protein Cob_v006162 [Colletotrichum orbiculare MAFF 240422]|uniref:Uncharacterized protein n=1 Tax=Colletotrichum orbiculare (strain 104-T / ATCC 96160 / CBS 514.97 / LARS 414 / MAFF 240422) TaxID=1213857 RepID=A0A484FRW2_COLOR|nr:hypothetical protein Cob_v006162 [Colletotrichum orbiculare MAFF 240422]